MLSHKQKSKRKQENSNKSTVSNTIKKRKSSPRANKTPSTTKSNEISSILRVACELKEKLINKSNRLSTTKVNTRRSTTPCATILYDDFGSDSSDDDNDDDTNNDSFESNYLFDSSLSSVSSLEFESFETSLAHAARKVTKQRQVKIKRNPNGQKRRFAPPISSSKSNIFQDTFSRYAYASNRSELTNSKRSARFNPFVTSSRRSLRSIDSTKECSLLIDNSNKKSDAVMNSTFNSTNKNMSTVAINDSICSVCNLISFNQASVLSSLNCRKCCQTELYSKNDHTSADCSLQNNSSSNGISSSTTIAQQSLFIQSINNNLLSENICSSTLLSRYHSDSKNSSISSSSSSSSSSSLSSSACCESYLINNNSKMLAFVATK
jgi:hypothetical protein